MDVPEGPKNAAPTIGIGKPSSCSGSATGRVDHTWSRPSTRNGSDGSTRRVPVASVICYLPSWTIAIAAPVFVGPAARSRAGRDRCARDRRSRAGAERSIYRRCRRHAPRGLGTGRGAARPARGPDPHNRPWIGGRNRRCRRIPVRLAAQTNASRAVGRPTDVAGGLIPGCLKPIAGAELALQLRGEERAQLH